MKISEGRLKEIIKEELLVMKLNRKIVVEHKKLASERKDYLSMIAEEYAKLERGEDFDVSTLEEGIWDSIKYYVGKLGSLEKGGKIFGDRKMRHIKAVDKLEAAIEKAGSSVIKDLRKNIEEKYKEFPNMKDKPEFLNALYEIAASYDAIDEAVKKGEMTADAANGVVEALREYVKYLLDYQLADVYKHFTEGKEIEEEVGKGGAPVDDELEQAANQKTFTKRGVKGDAVDSATLDGLASNKLPAILGLTGAAAVLAGLFAASPQALSALKQLRGLKNAEQITTGMKKITKTFGPADGEGFVQMVGRLTAGDPGAFGPNTDPNVFFKAVKSLGIDPNNPTQFFQLGADQGAYAQAVKSGAKTLGEMFPASNKDFYLDKGAKATSQIVQSVTKNLGTLGAGGGAAVAAGQLAAASTLATTLGIGLATAGAAVKLIRMKGQKSSRAQLLKDLSKELQPFENTEVVEPPAETPPTDPSPTDPRAGDRSRAAGPPPTDSPPTEPVKYEKPEKPYEFPLMDVENAIIKFTKDNGMDMDESDVEDLVGRIESWMQSARERGADYFDIDDRDFMRLGEGETIVQKGTGRAKLAGSRPKRRRYKNKDPRIAIKKGGRSRRSMSLSRYLHRLFSIGNDQGRPEFLAGLDNKQLRKLKNAIVNMVYKELSKQGPLVKQEVQNEPLLERWQKIAGISKKVL